MEDLEEFAIFLFFQVFMNQLSNSYHKSIRLISTSPLIFSKRIIFSTVNNRYLNGVLAALDFPDWPVFSPVFAVTLSVAVLGLATAAI
jgi:hypothetical protein